MNLLVPLGTSINDLLEAVGHRENPFKVLSGGPMMGTALYDLSAAVIKGTNAVTVLARKINMWWSNPAAFAADGVSMLALCI
jgi:electron transport complex protein RnfC